jgi:hypothetical protein
MTRGNAHIVFAGGNLALPADTPYDRQVLLEHVHGCTRSKQNVRVYVDNITWLVERRERRKVFVCGGCAQHILSDVCWRPGSKTAYCATCAMERPHLTIGLLADLPASTILRDVQAHYAYGGEWIPWTRWPEATPAEIIDDMRLQRRFAPVLIWRCAEIRLPSSTGASHPERISRRRPSTGEAASGKVVRLSVSESMGTAHGIAEAPRAAGR